jgi:hypothetical protein
VELHTAATVQAEDTSWDTAVVALESTANGTDWEARDAPAYEIYGSVQLGHGDKPNAEARSALFGSRLVALQLYGAVYHQTSHLDALARVAFLFSAPINKSPKLFAEKGTKTGGSGRNNKHRKS